MQRIKAMMTSSNGNIFRVTGHLCGEFTGHWWGEFPSQRPVTRSFDVYLICALNKQSRGWWFEWQSCSLWRHCNGHRSRDSQPCPAPINHELNSQACKCYFQPQIDIMKAPWQIAFMWIPWNPLMINQYWFRQWLGAGGEQTQTRANVDSLLCRHMASLGHDYSTQRIKVTFITLFTALGGYNCWPLLQWQRSAWWRHQMETLSALLAICAGNSPVTGEFPTQRPVTRGFDVFFLLCLNKQSWGWWFETPSDSLWRHCNGLAKISDT